MVPEVSRVGTSLGPYELVAELGHGGMATLYLAQRVGPAGFSRQVAVKVVNQAHQQDPTFVSMFLDEARLSARVQHPNVVHVEELGEQQGVPYLVMEYVDGVSLVDVMRALVTSKRATPIDMAVSIAAQVADGLHGAHESTDEHGRPLGIVHRDVSPHNILLSSRGHVKVIDFGIARARGRLTATEDGALKGKLAYLTPEQLAGDVVDRRSDIFTLAIVLWEMLTMRRLFHSSNDGTTMMRVREARVESPKQYRPEVSDALEHVVMVALARDRAERFQTAYAFRRALLSACSESLFVEPTQIAELVRDAARDSLERRRGAVPEELREATILAPPPMVEMRDEEGEIFVSRSRPSEDLPELEALVTRARESGDMLAEVRATGRLIGTLIQAGQHERAAGMLEGLEAMSAALTPGMRAFIASLGGQIAAARGDLAARIRAQASALELYEEAGWPKRAARAAVNLADAYNRFGAYEAAERELVAARARARQLEMPDTEAYAILNLAHAVMMQDRFGEAESLLKQGLHIAEARGETRAAIFASFYRADLLCRTGLWTAARAQAEKARGLAVDREWPGGEAMALTQLARAALAMGDRAGALAASERAYQIFLSLGSLEENEGLLYVVHIRALSAMGRDVEALAVREAARRRLESIAMRISDPDWRRRFLRHVGTHAEIFGSADP
jgi:serine/threonine protein kinase